jgi:hypothetical protein
VPTGGLLRATRSLLHDPHLDLPGTALLRQALGCGRGHTDMVNPTVSVPVSSGAVSRGGQAPCGLSPAT